MSSKRGSKLNFRDFQGLGATTSDMTRFTLGQLCQYEWVKRVAKPRDVVLDELMTFPLSAEEFLLLVQPLRLVERILDRRKAPEGRESFQLVLVLERRGDDGDAKVADLDLLISHHEQVMRFEIAVDYAL